MGLGAALRHRCKVRLRKTKVDQRGPLPCPGLSGSRVFLSHPGTAINISFIGLAVELFDQVLAAGQRGCRATPAVEPVTILANAMDMAGNTFRRAPS